jgi:hypothetical protein
VTVQCDTIRILTGRGAPVVTSIGRLPQADHERVRALAEHLTSQGRPYAAAGFALGDGRALVLRRMGDSMEVRGLVCAAGSAPSGVAALLEDHPLWANPAFAAGRTVPAASVRVGTAAPDSWCAGLRHLPAGFRPLGAQPAPSVRSAPPADPPPMQPVIVPPATSRGGLAAALHDPASSGVRGWFPGWPMAVCIGATACSMIFLAVVLATSPGRASASSAATVIAPPPAPAPAAETAKETNAKATTP